MAGSNAHLFPEMLADGDVRIHVGRGKVDGGEGRQVALLDEVRARNVRNVPQTSAQFCTR